MGDGVEAAEGKTGAQMPAPEDSRAGYSLADRLKHIEEVSKNARGTWFALIAALLFSAIAIGGVEDRDFFVFDSGLTLPVISYTVPLKPFFAVGSAIILGLYIYLHLYLAKLWRALAGIKPQPDGGLFLDDLVFPWLISDAAVYLKPGGPRRGGRWLTVAVAVLFLWAAGPLVLALFWWRSFPPHDVWLTLWVGLMLGVSLVAASVSFCGFMKILRGRLSQRTRWIWQDIRAFSVAAACLGTVAIAAAGVLRTIGAIEFDRTVVSDDGEGMVQAGSLLRFGDGGGWIYPASLYRAGLVERPDNWQPWDEARADFWRARRNEKPADPGKHDEWREVTGKTFSKRRKTMLDGLAARDFQTWSFRKAKAREVFLPGADLRGTDWRGADLTSANLEAANFGCAGQGFCANLQEAVLYRANLQEAVLWRANLQEAELSHANLQEAVLSYANLQEAVLSYANLQEAGFIGANLQEARFWYVSLQEAVLRTAKMQAAELWLANLQDADLSHANLQEAKLGSANLQGAELLEANLQDAEFDHANLQEARLIGANLQEAVLIGANLQAADLRGANLQEADLRGANLQEADLTGANLQAAVLWEANLQEAALWDANLQEADTRRANFSASLLVSADLSVNPFITQAQINSAFGDLTTQLPETCLNDNGEPQHCVRPPHWSADELTVWVVDDRWRDSLALRPQRPVKWDPANGWRYE